MGEREKEEEKEKKNKEGGWGEDVGWRRAGFVVGCEGLIFLFL